MTGVYLYLFAVILVLTVLIRRVMAKHRRKKEAYEDREAQVFYDAVKKIRRD